MDMQDGNEGRRMNTARFEDHWSRLNQNQRRLMRDLTKTPTDSNESYAVGYLSALRDNGLIAHNDHTYWLAVVGQIASVRSLILETFK